MIKKKILKKQVLDDEEDEVVVKPTPSKKIKPKIKEVELDEEEEVELDEDETEEVELDETEEVELDEEEEVELDEEEEVEEEIVKPKAKPTAKKLPISASKAKLKLKKKEEEEADEDEEEVVVKSKAKPTAKKPTATAKKTSTTSAKKTSKASFAMKAKPVKKEAVIAENGQTTREDFITLIQDEVLANFPEATLTKVEIAGLVTAVETVCINILSKGSKIRFANALMKVVDVPAKAYDGKVILERMDKGDGEDTLVLSNQKATWTRYIDEPVKLKGKIVKQKTDKRPGEFRAKGTTDIYNF